MRKKQTEPTKQNYQEVLEALRSNEYGSANHTLDRLKQMLERGDPEPEVRSQLLNAVSAIADLCNGVVVSNKAANLRVSLGK